MSLTADQLLRLPDDGFHRYELVRGRLTVSTPGGMTSGIATGHIGAGLGRYAEAHRAGEVGMGDVGVWLFRDPDTVRSLSICYVRRERIPLDMDEDHFWPVAPDIGVVTLSFVQGVKDVQEKLADFLAAGTPLLCVVDPDERAVTVFRPDRQPVRIDTGGVLDGEDVLPGFRLPLREVFDWTFTDSP